MEDQELRFRFRLALTLGRTVNELDESMSAKEYQEWQRYYNTEPFGPYANNINAARLLLAAISPHSDKPPSLEDLVLGEERQKEIIDPSMELKAMFQTMPKKE